MKPDLEKLRRSGFISATAREEGRKMIVPGAKLEDVAVAVEAILRDRGGAPGLVIRVLPRRSSRAGCEWPCRM